MLPSGRTRDASPAPGSAESVQKHATEAASSGRGRTSRYVARPGTSGV